MSERKKVRLGRTGLMVTKTSFGALPIQRVSFDEAAKLLRAAYEAGINFFDTANSYTDSEEKIGYALSDVRDKIIIATKSAYTTPGNADMVKRNLELSLRRMKTDYIDILQFHNPSFCPAGDDPAYQYLVEMKRQGVVRHIGITNHRLFVAHEAIDSGLYETLQFPFSVLATEKDTQVVEKCAQADVGFICMKAMSGGLIREPRATFAFLQRYPHVVPIYGVQRMSELEEWLELDAHPPVWDDALEASVQKERRELSGDFCRSCGYCLPCPQNIPIPNAARIQFLMTRSPYKPYLTKEWREGMDRIDSCIHCDHCKNHCPFGLDTPALLVSQKAWYDKFYEEHRDESEK